MQKVKIIRHLLVDDVIYDKIANDAVAEDQMLIGAVGSYLHSDHILCGWLLCGPCI